MPSVDGKHVAIPHDFTGCVMGVINVGKESHISDNGGKGSMGQDDVFTGAAKMHGINFFIVENGRIGKGLSNFMENVMLWIIGRNIKMIKR
jgi:hypothetical protein